MGREDSKDEAKISSQVFHSIGEHSNQCHCGEVDKDIRKDNGVGKNFGSQNNAQRANLPSTN